jgi:hypothetical protein
VSEYQGGMGKLFGALCFEHHEPVRKQLGTLCGANPLATQRAYELHMAAKTCGSLFELVRRHVERIEWQLRRVYRERNRIVHRANPSENVSALILNLNEYILVCMDAFFSTASTYKDAVLVDDIFSEILIREEARKRDVSSIASEKVSPENALLVAGFDLVR